jgi:uncharacterized protein YhhL (DUF1145 family)
VKIALAVVWIVCALAFVLPDAGWTVGARRLFVLLAVVHGLECVLFLSRMRAAGGSLAHHVVQTLLFGFLHLRTLPQK